VLKIPIPSWMYGDVQEKQAAYQQGREIIGLPPGSFASQYLETVGGIAASVPLSGSLFKKFEAWLSDGEDKAREQYRNLQSGYGGEIQHVPEGTPAQPGAAGMTDFDPGAGPGGAAGGGPGGLGAGGASGFDPGKVPGAGGFDPKAGGALGPSSGGFDPDASGFDPSGSDKFGSGLAGAGGGGLGGLGSGPGGLGPLGGSGGGLGGPGSGLGPLGAGAGGLGGRGMPPIGPAVSPGAGMMGGAGGAGAGRGGGRGAGGRGAAGRGAGGRGAGMMGAGGGHGGPGEGDDRSTWLQEDEDVWGADSGAPGPVIGA
jgi:hypothetical protein